MQHVRCIHVGGGITFVHWVVTTNAIAAAPITAAHTTTAAITAITASAAGTSSSRCCR